jgi:hypothetical protein
MSLLKLFENIPNEDDWFPKLVNKLDEFVDKMAEGNPKDETEIIVSALKNRKEDFKGLSRGSLTLFISYIAAGKTNEAAIEYIRYKASVDELISGMLQDAAAVINAKKHRDKLAAIALDIIKEITIEGAKKLLPLLILVI